MVVHARPRSLGNPLDRDRATHRCPSAPDLRSSQVMKLEFEVRSAAPFRHEPLARRRTMRHGHPGDLRRSSQLEQSITPCSPRMGMCADDRRRPSTPSENTRHGDHRWTKSARASSLRRRPSRSLVSRSWASDSASSSSSPILARRKSMISMGIPRTALRAPADALKCAGPKSPRQGLWVYRGA